MDEKKLIDWLAVRLCEEQFRQSDPEDDYTAEELKTLSVEILGDLHEVLQNLLPYELMENIYTLILDYGECRCKAYFIEGIETGTRLLKEIDSL